MNHELELRLQAWLDGQLPVGEADEVARLIEKEADARALLTELKHTRAALAGFAEDLKLPESREFYWSKIASQIQREQSQVATRPAAHSWAYHFRRLFVPAGALAALLLVGLLANRQTTSPDLPYELSDLVADSDAFTFTDEQNGTTLIWFTYAPEIEFAN